MSVNHVYGLLQLVAIDSNLVLKPVEQWPEELPEYDWRILEAKAARLTAREKEAFATGEDIEQERIARRKGVLQLSQFLNAAFDGELRDLFFAEKAPVLKQGSFGGHVTVSIAAALAQSSHTLGDMFGGDGLEVREEIKRLQASGRLWLLTDGCDNYDEITGKCLGH